MHLLSFIIMVKMSFLIILLAIFTLPQATAPPCPQTYYANSTSCQKCPEGCLTCLSQFSCTSCLNGYTLANLTCIYTPTVTAQFCGDGVFTTDQCDDGNKIDGDGCSSTCTIQQDYTCRYGSGTTPSQCSYTKALTLTLTSLLKQTHSNSLLLVLTVSPDVMAAKLFNWTAISSLNLTNCSVTGSSYSSGSLNLTIGYTISIDGLLAMLTITPPTAYAYSYSMVASTISFTVSPSNGQAYYFNPIVLVQGKIASVLFQVCIGIALTIFVAGSIYWPMVGLQFIMLLQTAFFTVSLINYYQPVLSSIADSSDQINGFNYQYNTGSSGMPSILGAMGVQPTFIENCNFMLVIEFAVGVLGGILYGISKLANLQQKDRLAAKAIYVTFQVTFLLVIFNMTNVGFSLAIHALQLGTTTISVESQIANSSVFALIIILAGVACFCYIKYPELFTHILPMYKKDFWSGYHPVILCIYRLLIGILMGALYLLYFRIAVLIAVQFGYFLYICIKRPYKHAIMFMNTFFNEFTGCIVLAMAAVYQFKPTLLFTDCSFGWVQISFILIATIASISSFFKSIFLVYFKNKILSIHPVDFEITQEDLEMNSKDKLKKTSNGTSPEKTKEMGEFKKPLPALKASAYNRLNNSQNQTIVESNNSQTSLV